MKKWTILGSSLFAAWLVAGCSSSSSVGTVDSGHEDTGTTLHKDAGPKKDSAAPKTDAGKDAKSTTPDTGVTTDAPTKTDAPTNTDGGAVASHVLITYDGTGATSTTSTLIAVNLATHAIDGMLTSADGQAITDTSNTASPFLLDQTLDIVSRLDSDKPWHVDSTWNVGLTTDAGQPYADTYAVTVSTESQVYVIRYLSNLIDILDTTNDADGGAPIGTVDLTSVVPAGSYDGLALPVAGLYVASSQRVYVVIENIQNYLSFPLTCGATKSAVTAIDTTTNKLVDLGGSGPGGSIELAGFDPVLAKLDSAGGRLLVFDSGCEAQLDGSTGGPQALAGVEAVDLTTNKATLLLDTSSLDGALPTEFVYIDTTHAVLGFQYPTAAYAWDPTSNALGTSFVNAPDIFAYDGNGNLVGATINFGADAGTETTDIISMALATGTATTLLSNATPIGAGYIGSVGMWPKP